MWSFLKEFRIPLSEDRYNMSNNNNNISSQALSIPIAAVHQERYLQPTNSIAFPHPSHMHQTQVSTTQYNNSFTPSTSFSRRRITQISHQLPTNITQDDPHISYTSTSSSTTATNSTNLTTRTVAAAAAATTNIKHPQTYPRSCRVSPESQHYQPPQQSSQQPQQHQNQRQITNPPNLILVQGSKIKNQIRQHVIIEPTTTTPTYCPPSKKTVLILNDIARQQNKVYPPQSRTTTNSVDSVSTPTQQQAGNTQNIHSGTSVLSNLRLKQFFIVKDSSPTAKQSSQQPSLSSASEGQPMSTSTSHSRVILIASSTMKKNKPSSMTSTTVPCSLPLSEMLLLSSKKSAEDPVEETNVVADFESKGCLTELQIVKPQNNEQAASSNQIDLNQDSNSEKKEEVEDNDDEEGDGDYSSDILFASRHFNAASFMKPQSAHKRTTSRMKRTTQSTTSRDFNNNSNNFSNPVIPSNTSIPITNSTITASSAPSSNPISFTSTSTTTQTPFSNSQATFTNPSTPSYSSNNNNKQGFVGQSGMLSRTTTSSITSSNTTGTTTPLQQTGTILQNAALNQSNQAVNLVPAVVASNVVPVAAATPAATSFVQPQLTTSQRSTQGINNSANLSANININNNNEPIYNRRIIGMYAHPNSIPDEIESRSLEIDCSDDVLAAYSCKMQKQQHSFRQSQQPLLLQSQTIAASPSVSETCMWMSNSQRILELHSLSMTSPQQNRQQLNTHLQLFPGKKPVKTRRSLLKKDDFIESVVLEQKRRDYTTQSYRLQQTAATTTTKECSSVSPKKMNLLEKQRTEGRFPFGEQTDLKTSQQMQQQQHKFEQEFHNSSEVLTSRSSRGGRSKKKKEFQNEEFNDYSMKLGLGIDASSQHTLNSPRVNGHLGMLSRGEATVKQRIQTAGEIKSVLPGNLNKIKPPRLLERFICFTQQQQQQQQYQQSSSDKQSHFTHASQSPSIKQYYHSARSSTVTTTTTANMNAQGNKQSAKITINSPTSTITSPRTPKIRSTKDTVEEKKKVSIPKESNKEISYVAKRTAKLC